MYSLTRGVGVVRDWIWVNEVEKVKVSHTLGEEGDSDGIPKEREVDKRREKNVRLKNFETLFFSSQVYFGCRGVLRERH